MSSRLFGLLRLATLLGLITCLPRLATADELDDLLKDLPWRNIGPAIMGGRINDFAVSEKNPAVIYTATASGGLFKSVNNGTTWEPLFDTQPVSTLGDVTLAPSNPEIVWVGSGEANNRQSSSWGNGVYRSTDGGKTWSHLGLAETHHIGRIVVHPTNPDIAYVAAGGKLWGASPERGVFKTTDGGKTWSKVLYLNEDTGCTDLLLDPQNPDTLYAAMYQRRRTAFGFNGGGPHSGLHRTTDGGKTWTKLTQGLPTGDTGRIGLDLYRKDSKIVYAIVENAAGGIFRSEDRGETWTKMSSTNPRPMYYSQIRIDPNDDKRIWVLGVALSYSEDGGKNFRGVASRIHTDHHAFWINPANSDHVLLGCDGGIQCSYDRGRTWDYINTLALGQFYEVCYDFQKPYFVYGGLQDNGSWGGPSRTPYFSGPTNDDWFRIGGGDGFYAQADPTNANILYVESQQGFLERRNQATGESKFIRPRPQPGEKPYRFDWNSPILISPHNPKKVYFGGNRLFISEDRGDTWRRTEDLTTNPDRDKMMIMGVVPDRKTLSLHDGQEGFGQILTVSESPKQAGLLYVGTDDGCLQVSRDDGKTWKNVADRVPGVPKGTYVSRVVASAHQVGRAYLTLDGHRSNDFKPYVFVTEDFGETWRSIAANLPEGGTLSVIREHPRTPNLLFVGAERGLWLSFDRGARWIRMGAPLPTVPVDDIQIHPRENDLILGTHGRSIWILDDIGPLVELAQKALLQEVTLVPPRTATMWRLSGNKGDTGHKLFIGSNPPSGASIQFLLRGKAADASPSVSILDASGKYLLRELSLGRIRAGLNRATWDFRQVPSPLTLEEARAAQASGQATTPPAPTPRRQRGERNFSFGPRGPRVLPGTYRVRLTVGKEEWVQSFQVEEDPRLTATPAERKAQYSTLLRLNRLYESAEQTRRTLRDARTQLTDMQETEEWKKAPTALQERVKEALKQIGALEGRLTQPAPRGPRAGGGGSGEATPSTPTEGGQNAAPPAPSTSPLLSRITTLHNSVDSITEAPSRSSHQEADTLEKETRQVMGAANALQSRLIAPLQRDLEAAKLLKKAGESKQ